MITLELDQGHAEVQLKQLAVFVSYLSIKLHFSSKSSYSHFIDQRSCGDTTSYNNTYWYNSGYPNSFNGGQRCTIVVSPMTTDVCQLRIDFLDFSLAQPNGDGTCATDYMTVTGGSSRVPRICGENTGQHVYVHLNGQSSVTISVETTGSVSFNRRWHFQIAQMECSSPYTGNESLYI